VCVRTYGVRVEVLYVIGYISSGFNYKQFIFCHFKKHKIGCQLTANGFHYLVCRYYSSPVFTFS